MSIEAYFVINVAMNALILWISARATQAKCTPRIGLSALLGGVYALFAQNTPVMRTWAALWAMAWLMTLISQPYRGVIPFARGSMLTVSLAMLFGGVALALNQWVSGMLMVVTCAAAGFLLTRWLLSARARSMRFSEIEMSIDGSSVKAIIDTGNHLREPISQCPVIIVEAAMLGDVSDKKCRKVAFASVGGQGYLACYKPEHLVLYSNGHPMSIEGIWVAIYEGDLRGRALAPPEVIDMLQNRNLNVGGIHLGKRIFSRKAHMDGNAL